MKLKKKKNPFWLWGWAPDLAVGFLSTNIEKKKSGK